MQSAVHASVRLPASSMPSVQEGVGDYGSLLGGIIQLAVTPLGQGPPSQFLDRVAMRQSDYRRAHTCPLTMAL